MFIRPLPVRTTEDVVCCSVMVAMVKTFVFPQLWDVDNREFSKFEIVQAYTIDSSKTSSLNSVFDVPYINHVWATQPADRAPASEAAFRASSDSGVVPRIHPPHARSTTWLP